MKEKLRDRFLAIFTLDNVGYLSQWIIDAATRSTILKEPGIYKAALLMERVKALNILSVWKEVPCHTIRAHKPSDQLPTDESIY